MIVLPESFWEIRNTDYKGRGLFAREDISKGTIIGDYIGKVIHPRDAEIDEENFYLMYYHDYALISPDIELPGVHLVNHSCLPNSWLYIYRGHTLAFALRDISKGEELTISYLLAPKTKYEKECAHICKCGQNICVGTIHLSEKKYEQWRKITEKQSKETKKQKITYGEYLPSLTSYPKIHNEYIDQVNSLVNL